MNAPLPKKQWVSVTRRIWGLAGRIQKSSGVDKEDLVRTHVRSVYGKASLKELTPAQLGELAMWLSRQADGLPQAPKGKAKPKKASKPRKVDPRMADDDYAAGAKPRPTAHITITEEQRNALDLLRAGLGWDLKRYRGFCKRQVGFAWPQSRRQAVSVHEGMEAMLKREWPAQRQSDVFRLLTTYRPQLTDWERGFLANVEERARAGELHFSQIAKLAEIYRKRVETNDER